MHRNVNGKKKMVWKDGCYFVWKGVLSRVYATNYENPNLRTYVDCTICEEWHYASCFKTWYDINFVSGWHLDKDILVRGNKEYGPNTCAFVPTYINNLFTDSSRNRGEWPIGVHKTSRATKKPNAKNFVARCSDAVLGRLFLGLFSTPEDAHKAWQKEKINQVQKAIDRFRLEVLGYRRDVEDALLQRIEDIKNDLNCNLETIKL